MKIIVLVKQVPDTWGERTLDASTGRLDRAATDAVVDEIDERALEVALAFRDAGGDAEIVALTLGPASANDTLKKALALGADSAIHVLDDGLVGADVGVTSAAIAAALDKAGFDLVIAGNEATDGRGGVVPTMVAARLGVASLTSLNSVEIDSGSVRGERGTEFGTATLHADLPAVVSITERTPEARFPNFRGIMKAKKKPVSVWNLGDLGLGSVAAHSLVLSITERPARTAGTKIVDEGSAADELADFLAAGRLL